MFSRQSSIKNKLSPEVCHCAKKITDYRLRMHQVYHCISLSLNGGQTTCTCMVTKNYNTQLKIKPQTVFYFVEIWNNFKITCRLIWHYFKRNMCTQCMLQCDAPYRSHPTNFFTSVLSESDHKIIILFVWRTCLLAKLNSIKWNYQQKL